MSKIKELIEVPEVKTVIQMSDIEDSQLRNFLMESFLLTDEVEKILNSFLRDICQGQGKGYFLEGNFGSGKSHLLTVISLLFSYRQSWNPLLAQDESGRLQEYFNTIDKENYSVVNISLVEHSSNERLEQIINNGIRGVFSDFLTDEKDYKRKDFYRLLADKLAGEDCIGLVILIDELSEFLRSKPDGRSFNEDIRYLQFMGEFVNGKNCWLMATLQEAIEKTGEITQEIFGKIKDRYPVHYHLTGTHIREIVARRLIHKKSGAEQKISDIYQKYSNAFSDWSVSREDFLQLYPVNPLAVPLLDNLKPLFSQHRGIIDFIHYRLKGDKSRGIKGTMEKQAENLLNPDLIFDHFLDRLRERMETGQYYEKVYRYYEQEIDNILPSEEVEIGLRIIKLLILFAVSPVEKEYLVKDIVHMLLKPVTDLDPEVNYEYIDDLLKKMYRHGAYITRKEGQKTAANSYSLNLKADINLIIREKTDFIKSNFFADEKRIFTRTGTLVEETYLPLARLLEKPKTIRKINWQNTQRSGYFCLLSLTDITLKGISEFNERLQQADLEQEEDIKDFVIFLGYPLKKEKQKKHLKEVIMPELKTDIRAGYCFWLPAEIEEKEYLQTVLSRMLLYDEYQEKQGETATKVCEKLDSMLEEDGEKIATIFHKAFFAGDLINGDGEVILSLKEMTTFSFNKIIERIASSILEKRYPDHVRIAPYQAVINKNQLNRLCSHFLESGVIERDQACSRGIINMIEDVLKPMGVIKQRGNKIRLKIKPGKNPLLKAFFSSLDEEKTEINKVFYSLRRSNYGLSRAHFKTVVLLLLFSGYITSYSGKQKISLNQLSIYNFDRIKYIGYGEIIEEEFQQILQNCSLLPPRLKKQPFSLPLQQEIWNFIVEWKRTQEQEINNLKARIANLSSGEDFSFCDSQELFKNLEKINNLLSEIKVSYSAEEGLERFAAAYRNLPNSDHYLERYQLINQFFNEKYDKYLEIRDYLGEIPLLPGKEKYKETKKLINELEDSLKDRDIIFSDDFLDNLEEKFKDFRNKYSEKYYAEHHKNLSEERFIKYHKIKESSPYNVLSYLADIEMISVKDDLVKVSRKLARVLRRECNRLDRKQLLRRPVCTCGFKPGQNFENISVKEIHKTISAGIKSYLKKLNSQEFRPRIEKYLDNMEAAGEKRFSRPVRNLLQIADKLEENNINSEKISKLEKILNRNVIKRINQALAGSINLVERNLDSLYENLVGRSFSPEQIKNIFRDWLEAGQSLDKKSYIKVISTEAENNQAKTNNDLEKFLEKYYPEMLTLYDNLGQDRFIIFSAVCAWKEMYGLAFSDLKKIIDDIEDYLEENTENHLQLWKNLLIENKEIDNQETRKKTDIILEKEHIIDNLLQVMSVNELDDLFSVLMKEFISFNLLKEVLILIVKKVEKTPVNKYQQKFIPELKKTIEKTADSQRKNYLQTAFEYLKLRPALSYLENDRANKFAENFKEVYQENLSQLEYNLSSFLYYLGELKLSSELPVRSLRDKVRKTVQQYIDKFNNNQGLEEEEKLKLPDLVIEKYPELLKKINHETSCCILLDGMRLDIWQVILQKIRNNISLRVIREGLLYSKLPTNTETQIELLREKGYKGDIIKPEEFSPQYLDDNKQDQIIRFSFIDDRVHTSKEDYFNFVEEIIFKTENRLIPFLQQLPKRTAILFFSDHGYRLNYAFSKQNKYQSQRYLHGGNTPFEVIVPWSFLFLV